MSLRIDGLMKRFGEVQALDGVSLRGRTRRGLRFPRRERCREDDDHADRARPAPRRRRRVRGTGSTAKHRSGHDGPGAICPRSAACTDGWACSTSSCSSRRCTTSPGAGRAGTRSPGSGGSGSSDVADRTAETLSKGNQQKVQFIATVLHDPDVILMDEPFSGLDPVNVALLKAAFLEMRDRGKTLVFSTHQLDHGRGVVRFGRDHRPRTARDDGPHEGRQALDRPPGRPSRHRSRR